MLFSAQSPLEDVMAITSTKRAVTFRTPTIHPLAHKDSGKSTAALHTSETATAQRREWLGACYIGCGTEFQAVISIPQSLPKNYPSRLRARSKGVNIFSSAFPWASQEIHPRNEDFLQAARGFFAS